MPGHRNTLSVALGTLAQVEKPDRDLRCRICHWEVQLLPVFQVGTHPLTRVSVISPPLRPSLLCGIRQYGFAAFEG
jgi:hypothetical protein